MSEEEFDIDSDEYEKVFKIAKKWTKDKEEPSNGTAGEMLARKFKKYVLKKHPKVAKMVERDSTIYEAVLMGIFLEK